MIIRIDDVLTTSSQWSGRRGPEQRCSQVIRWLSDDDINPKIVLMPTIVVSDIQNFPQTIETLRHLGFSGKVNLQLHGYEHIDYNAQPEKLIKEHIEKSLQWFKDTLWTEPTIWATPWGADSEKLRSICNEYNLVLDGVKDYLDPGGWIKAAKINFREAHQNLNIMDHWWCRGLKLLRVAEILRYESYQEAAKARSDIF